MNNIIITSIYLSVCLSIYLITYLSIKSIFISICLSIYLLTCLSINYLYTYLLT